MIPNKVIISFTIVLLLLAYLDATTNGLSYAIEKFKKHDLSGHITLVKGERSKIATLAAKIL